MTPGRPIRVLHLLYSTSRSGVGLWLLDLMPYLQRAGFAIDVATLMSGPGPLDEALSRAGARVTHLGTARHYPRFRARFRELVVHGGPYRIVHSSLPYGGIQLRLAAALGVPVRIAHSHTDMRPLEAEQPLTRRLVNRLERVLVARAATIRLAVSELAAEGLFGAEQSCLALPCGRDYSIYGRPVDRAMVRRALGLPEDAFVLGHVGRLQWQKNHAFLLRITAEVVRRRPATRLLLLGTGELREALERQAEDLGIGANVVFAGDRTDIPELLLGAVDVFVFPSHYEGLALAMIEAQAAGLPCLMASHLTAQAIVVPELVHRLPLEAPADAWAEAALVRAGGGVERAGALERVLTSEFAIEPHAAKVIKLYQAALDRA
jgi:glycosyltransferase involved in cell wall biosynthesis